MIATDLEALREMFSDDRTHLGVARVIKISLTDDRSVLKAQCRILTQNRDVIARVCWDACGPDAGSFMFPVPDDLVLVAFSEGDDEQAYLIKRLSTRTDTIPPQAVGGHMVSRSLAGLNNYLMSDTKILLGQGGTADPAEPLVLGNVLVAALTDLNSRITALVDAISQGPIAISTAPGSLAPTAPGLKSALANIKTQLSSDLDKYLVTESTNIVSKLSYTERGT